MRIFFGKLPENLKNDDHIKDPPWIMTIPLIGVVLLAAFLGLYPSFILDLFDPVITQVLANR